ncbi:TetR/AcrR family transcriptional regulator [Nocardia sp. NPDC056000]|uniref:TetR/AcrR family transcriptional regulator n=1 Tax=Nocardia sp. NPDC056000 TaxID=3345674 RepID=UPI0035D92AC5
MTPRPLTAKGQSTKARILSACGALIVSRGLAATTLDDVCAATGTSKSQLFHYFPGGKDELLQSLAQREADSAMDRMRARIPSLSTCEGWSQWRDQLLGEYDLDRNDCPSGLLLIDLGRAGSGARAVIAEFTEQLQRVVESGIESLQANGSVRADLDARRSAAALVAGIHGANALLLATGSTTYLAAAFNTAIENLRAGPSRMADTPIDFG